MPFCWCSHAHAHTCTLAVEQPAFHDGLEEKPAGAPESGAIECAIVFVDPDKGILLQEYQPIQQVRCEVQVWRSYR